MWFGWEIIGGGLFQEINYRCAVRSVASAIRVRTNRTCHLIGPDSQQKMLRWFILGLLCCVASGVKESSTSPRSPIAVTTTVVYLTPELFLESWQPPPPKRIPRR